MYKVTLSHEIEGEFVITEPEGLSTALFGTERHPDFWCPVEFMETPVNFYGSNDVDIDGGLRFALLIEKKYGPNAELKVNVKYTDSDNEDDLEEMYTGSIPILTFRQYLTDQDYGLEAGFGPDNFWVKFIGNAEKPVDVRSLVDLFGNAVTQPTIQTIALPAQPINEVASFSGHAGLSLTSEDCFCASTVDIVLSGHQLLDGVMTADGMRVLVRAQANPKNNGPYIPSAGAWVRTLDANTSTELQYMVVKVLNGATLAGKVYRQTTTPFILGTDNVVFVETNFVDTAIFFDGSATFTYTGVTHLLRRYAQILPDKIRNEIVDTFNSAFVTDSDPSNYTTIDSNLADVIPAAEFKTGGKVKISSDLLFNLYHKFRFQVNAGGGSETIDRVDATVNIYYKIGLEAPVLMASGNGSYVTGLPLIAPTHFGQYDGAITPIHIVINDYTIDGISDSDLLYFYAEYLYTLIPRGNNFISLAGDHFAYGGLSASESSISLRTLTLPSNVEGLLLHDLLASVIKRTTGKSDSFNSPVLGSRFTTEKAYPVDGDYWAHLVMPGLQLKQWLLSEKPFSISSLDIWKGIAPIFNLALKQGTINKESIEIIKLDDMLSHDVSITFLNVASIERSYEEEHYPKVVKVGCLEWKSTDIQGIDDPQSVREMNSPTRIGKIIEIMTTWVLASLTIEKLRRQPKSNTSSDNSYDDKVFMISLNRNVLPLTPSLNEKFTSVTGLLDAEYRYNKDLTPMRILLRHLKLLFGGLQAHVGELLSFGKGTGNFDMESTMVDHGLPEEYAGQPLSEKEDIAITSSFNFIPQPYIIIVPMGLRAYRTVITNSTLSIGISQTTEDAIPFIIKKVSWNPEEGIGTFIAWPTREFTIAPPQDDVEQSEVITIFSDEFNHPPFN